MKKKIRELIKFPLLKLLSFLSDELFIKLQYQIKLKKKVDLQNPKTFTEKLQWIKLNERTSLMTTVADKYKVRDYVANQIGSEYLIHLLWVGENPEDIPFESLPKSFVIKTNQGSGFNILVDDKEKCNPKKVKKKLRKMLKTDYALIGRQWAYKNIERKIIIEEYLRTSEGIVPEDYKLFVFNGKVEFIQIDFDRFGNHERQFYDRNWNRIHFEIRIKSKIEDVRKPENLDKIIKLSEILSKEFSFSRIDFYDYDDKIKFGEITLYPGGGYSKIKPSSYDLKFGEKLKLK